MIFVVRDDDTCAFTSPEQLRDCYERVWADVPISLSVTPFRIAGHDRHAPEQYKGSMEILPLGRNLELVAVLREGLGSGRLDVTMHGYHHLRYGGAPEFIGGEDLSRKAREGKAYLEQLLGTAIRTFVPPNNGIARQGLRAVIDAGMNLGGMLPLWSPKFRRVSLRALSLYPRVMWHQKVRRRRYPHILDFGDHGEIACHTVGPRSSWRQLVRELNYCRGTDGTFVLATHYHAFERETEDGYKVGKVVYELIERAAAFPETQFLGFNSIWKKRQE